MEQAVALILLGWLVGSVLLLARSIREGRELAAQLASRHPDEYEALGRPRPGYLQSVRRDRFAVFVARREYEDLGDPPLAARFDAYRRSEARLVIAILATMAALVALALFARHDAWGAVAALV